MKPKAATEAARELAAAWRIGHRLPELHEDCRPRTLADGYQVQSRLVAELEIPLGGWKIGCTSAAARKILKARGPFAGRVFAPRIFASGARLPSSIYNVRGLEGEFAFRLGKDLKPRARPYSRANVLEAIDTLHPALEIIDSRFEDWMKVNLACIVADMAANAALVLGPPVKRWRTLDLAKQAVRMTVDGKVVGEGTGAAVMGDPIEALRWLANWARRRGGLAAGDVVTTGTCTGMQRAPAGKSTVAAEFGKLGAVRVDFT